MSLTLQEINEKLATCSNVVMGQRWVLREVPDQDMRVEIQDVEIWGQGRKQATARFTTYRRISTGKAVIAHIDPVDGEELA